MWKKCENNAKQYIGFINYETNVQKCENIWKPMKKCELCEKMWKQANIYERMWKNVNQSEKCKKKANKCEQNVEACVYFNLNVNKHFQHTKPKFDFRT